MITNNKKIMVCDDDQGILDVIQMLLETENFTVYTEVHSPNLISSIKLHSPDLLLLDLWMPFMAGDELLKTIRHNDDIKNLPVIVLSASVDGSDIAEDAGANAFIAKPFDMNDLISKVKGLLMN
ncbi:MULTISPECIES: response regulator [Chryseobacterium]|jgi:CheY-like chemotaxis protein|uniref:Response regulator ArlR n=1 Tax=Chryseobacterium balustinum TaxID=246 RepID=A0AAX2ILH0_9FLAO|nr:MULTISPECIES: response regulator [Chryseobacterium]AZB29361.1 response regulator [Chryseobacterium balustinum]MDY0932838.1 response regulator [Chryseobacterium sp. CFBP8996]SKC02071.1 two-component system, OmpR family, alkaline phosphatase synthesis response regulator PhoP [Chryseobacterium balustinum]SQA90651.1 Response regulator ArlR [Chryseobacterium balustinum]